MRGLTEKRIRDRAVRNNIRTTACAQLSPVVGARASATHHVGAFAPRGGDGSSDDDLLDDAGDACDGDRELGALLFFGMAVALSRAGEGSLVISLVPGILALGSVWVTHGDSSQKSHSGAE